MKSYTYSPFPLAQYQLPGLATCEAHTILTAMDPDDQVPVWNLFWLSNPQIDLIPGAGRKWWRVYTPTAELLKCAINDALVEPFAAQKLAAHPEEFIEWFTTEPHEDYKLYELRGKAWVDTVLERAREASDRLVLAEPPIVVMDNVISLASYRRTA